MVRAQAALLSQEALPGQGEAPGGQTRPSLTQFACPAPPWPLSLPSGSSLGCTQVSLPFAISSLFSEMKKISFHQLHQKGQV